MTTPIVVHLFSYYTLIHMLDGDHTLTSYLLQTQILTTQQFIITNSTVPEAIAAEDLIDAGAVITTVLIRGTIRWCRACQHKHI